MRMGFGFFFSSHMIGCTLRHSDMGITRIWCCSQLLPWVGCLILVIAHSGWSWYWVQDWVLPDVGGGFIPDVETGLELAQGWCYLKSSPGFLVVLIRTNWLRDHRPELYAALSFLLRASTAATCIFTTTCTATIITFASRAEFQHFISEFQHLISRFNKISLHGRPHSKSRFGSKRRLKDRVKTRWL
jgi:hypothetical protein